MSNLKLEVERTKNSRLQDFDFSNIPFGRNFSDHILVADYKNGEWISNKIVPFQLLNLSPATTSFHYAQSIFEGIKAHRNIHEGIVVFRPEENFKRMNNSATRLAMPQIPKEIFMDGMMELIKLDEDWVPKAEGTSLYIRPVMFGTEPFIGVKVPTEFKFIIMTSPVGAYYSEDVSVYVDEENARATKGMGCAKFAGNYAASLAPVEAARAKGYKDVLWLDSEHHQYVQEVGTMNIFFVKNGNTIITPELDGGLLPGITRDSILKLATHRGYQIEERLIDINELIDEIEKGEITEVFGSGTAAVITYIYRLGFRGRDYLFDTSKYTVSIGLRKELVDIQKGKEEDIFNWVTPIHPH
ncbi:MAG: branched-chain amino acid aminotransferase [Chitinophagales bacterium]|nr:branched-chain amino acid aminotransferase [Chitinophagales bacterium]